MNGDQVICWRQSLGMEFSSAVSGAADEMFYVFMELEVREAKL